MPSLSRWKVYVLTDAAACFGLPAATVSALRAVLERHSRVSRGGIYGSRAKGTWRKGSDIDVVLFGEALTQEDLARIDNEIDALNLPYQVDLSLYASIESTALRAHIAHAGRLLYGRGLDRAPG